MNHSALVITLAALGCNASDTVRPDRARPHATTTTTSLPSLTSVPKETPRLCTSTHRYETLYTGPIVEPPDPYEVATEYIDDLPTRARHFSGVVGGDIERTTTFVHNANGQLTESVTVDANGVEESRQTLTYDADGQLTEDATTSTWSTRRTTYAYDDDGNLIEEVLDVDNAITLMVYAYDDEDREVMSGRFRDGLDNWDARTDRFYAASGSSDHEAFTECWDGCEQEGIPSKSLRWDAKPGTLKRSSVRYVTGDELSGERIEINDHHIDGVLDDQTVWRWTDFGEYESLNYTDLKDGLTFWDGHWTYDTEERLTRNSSLYRTEAGDGSPAIGQDLLVTVDWDCEAE